MDREDKMAGIVFVMAMLTLAVFMRKCVGDIRLSQAQQDALVEQKLQTVELKRSADALSDIIVAYKASVAHPNFHTFEIGVGTSAYIPASSRGR